MEIRLVPLSADDSEDVYQLLQAIPAEENGFVNGMAGKTREEFRTWLIRQEENAKKTEIEDGWRVPQAVYWLYVDGRPVGMGKLRYFLTDALRKVGGHIGYAIAPQERGKGYGKKLLQCLLMEAKSHDINPVLATIRPDNKASIATALRCGGRVADGDDERVRIWFDI